MGDSTNTTITIEATIFATVENVWEFWTEPEHIKKWNNASADWHTTNSENDLKVGGRFSSRMESKDGSFGFDFWGIYDEVKQYHLISYTLGDGRKVSVSFDTNKNETKVVEIFESENTHSIEQQKNGWQAILDNFKRYLENRS